MSPFHNVPAQVCSPLCGCKMVNFFESVLADIPNPKITCYGVERETEGIAQAKEPDLCTASACCKGIAWRNGIVQSGGMRGVNIDSEHFAEERICILTVPEGVAAAATISESDIKEAILAECETAAVVVRERLIDREEDVFRCGVREIGIGRRSGEFGDDGL